MGDEGYNITYNYIDLYKVSEYAVDNNNVSSTHNNSTGSVQERLSAKLENLITYKYSQQGGGIFAIGTKNGAYSFYRFDANSLALEKSFYNVGLNRNYSINGIDALSGGRFKIYTSGGTYIFNYFNGTLN